MILARFTSALIRTAPIVLLLGLLVPVAAPAAEPGYTLGVFPHLPARELENVFSPMAADMSKGVGVPVQFRSASSYQAFMEKLDEQTWDIVFLQPFDYVRAHDQHGYLPLAGRQEMLSAVIMVLPESPIQSIKDLKGKKIALPPPPAAVSRLTIEALREAGLDPKKDVSISHYKSHVSCMQQVMLKAADACGTAAPAVRFFKAKMNRELRQVAESRKIPHSLFAVHPRVPEERRRKLQETILGWGKTPEGKAMLERGRHKPFRVIEDKEYDIVRKFSRSSGDK